MQQKSIICFTAAFPFGKKETYFESELVFLAEEFDVVYIIPTIVSDRSSIRRVPENVVVLNAFITSESPIGRMLRGIFNFAPFGGFIGDFFKYKVYASLKNVKIWFRSLLVFRTSYVKMKHIFSQLKVDHNTIMYAYWAHCAFLFPTPFFKHFRKITRLHAGDFYLNRSNGYLPVRSQIYQASDLLVPISNDIASILKSHYGILEEKIMVNHLGIINLTEVKMNNASDVIRIVSCSNIIPLKRLNLICEALKIYKGEKPIEWHHFGDGPDEVIIKTLIKELPGNVTATLHGRVSQVELFDFYSNNYVTWVINVSKHEGIPVSIMEAFSFGIPAIATNVGATNELVNEENGYLIPEEVDINNLIYLIGSNEPGYQNKRFAAYNTWKERFNAITNYKKLTSKILEKSAI